MSSPIYPKQPGLLSLPGTVSTLKTPTIAQILPPNWSRLKWQVRQFSFLCGIISVHCQTTQKKWSKLGGKGVFNDTNEISPNTSLESLPFRSQVSANKTVENFRYLTSKLYLPTCANGGNVSKYAESPVFFMWGEWVRISNPHRF